MALIAQLSATLGTRCAVCHQPLTAADVEVDHIVPVALGGSNVARNLRLLHRTCNRARGARL